MKSVLFERFGEPADVLGVVDRDVPVPGSGQVRVRVLASPVNPSDLMTVRGTYAKLPSLPACPGYEGVGVVESSGPGLLGRLLVGRRVAFLSADGGAWSGFHILPARQAAPVSSRIPIEQAAMFFVNPTTAYVLMREVLRVPKGDWVLQTAAGSAVGRMVIRLAHRYGFRTFNVVRRSELAAELRKSGADEVLATDTLTKPGDLVDCVRQITGGSGVRYAIDCVSGELGSNVVRCLAPRGRLVVFGTMSREPLTFSSRDLMTAGASVEGFWLGNFLSSLGLVGKLRIVSTVGRLIREGILASEVGEIFPLDQVRNAVVAAEREARGGKVLLRVATP